MDEERRLDFAIDCLVFAQQRVGRLEGNRYDLQHHLDRTGEAIARSMARMRESDDDISSWWFRPFDR